MEDGEAAQRGAIHVHGRSSVTAKQAQATHDRQTDRHKGTMQKVEQSKGMPANKRKNTVVWTRQKTKAQQHPHVQRLWA